MFFNDVESIYGKEFDVNLLGKEFFPREQYRVLFDRFTNNEATSEARARFLILLKEARYIAVSSSYRIYDTTQPLYPDHEPVNYRLEYSDEPLAQSDLENWSGDLLKVVVDFRLGVVYYRLIDVKTDHQHFELRFDTTGDLKQLGETEILFYL